MLLDMKTSKAKLQTSNKVVNIRSKSILCTNFFKILVLKTRLRFSVAKQKDAIK